MARKQKTIHYLYKTTCIITGRWYIGMHSTSNLDDGYMGSGKRLRYSRRKYGIDNHKKEIIEFFDTKELLVEAEKTAITPEMLLDDMCMNLAEGGTGGHGAKFLTKEQLSKGGKNAIDKIHHTQWVTNGEKNRKRLAAFNTKNWKNPKHKKKILENLDWTGKQHTQDTKKLMSEKAKERTGEKNSQYGTCWITKDGLNKKIKKEELKKYLKQKWKLGRIIK